MDKRIEEIKERERSAAPGPWVCNLAQSEISQALSDVVACIEQRIERYEWTEEDYANAEFIAHAREDIPYLLGRIAALEAAAEDVQEWVRPNHPHAGFCSLCGADEEESEHRSRYCPMIKLDAALNLARPGAAPSSGAE